MGESSGNSSSLLFLFLKVKVVAMETSLFNTIYTACLTFISLSDHESAIVCVRTLQIKKTKKKNKGTRRRKKRRRKREEGGRGDGEEEKKGGKCRRR
jgi:hypothetical protein